MKGFIRTTAAGICLSAGAVALTGCTQYRNHVDPCWPERYAFETRVVVKNTFDAQAANGHVLDQTIWNWDFEKDDKGNPTDRLSLGGQERLKSIVRRRPVPDGKIYIQTANDLPAGFDVKKYADKRQEVDTARIAAVHEYLGAYMAGRSTQVAWDIAVHDPVPVGLPAAVIGGVPPGTGGTLLGANGKLNGNFQGVLGTVQGFTTPGGGGGGASGGGASGASGQQGQGQGQQGQSQQGGGQAGAPPGN